MHEDEISTEEAKKLQAELSKLEQTEDVKRKLHALEVQIKRNG